MLLSSHDTICVLYHSSFRLSFKGVGQIMRWNFEQDPFKLLFPQSRCFVRNNELVSNKTSWLRKWTCRLSYIFKSFANICGQKVFYHFDDSLLPQDQAVIRQAMQTIEDLSCVRCLSSFSSQCLSGFHLLWPPGFLRTSLAHNLTSQWQ